METSGIMQGTDLGMPAATEIKPARRGRPRDPNLEARVHRAAVELYADTGWDGFNFDRVAKRAGVGKAALYDRWANRETLFRSAFEARWQPLAAINTGNLATDLEQWVQVSLDRFLEARGSIVFNMQADGLRNEGFRKVAQPFYAVSLGRITRIFERAVARGELSGEMDSDVASLLVHGTIAAKIAREQMSGHSMTAAQKHAFARSLVKMTLKALGIDRDHPTAGPTQT